MFTFSDAGMLDVHAGRRFLTTA